MDVDSKEGLTDVELEKGVEQPQDNAPDNAKETETANSKSAPKRSYVVAGVIIAVLALFVIIFPSVYVTQKRKNEAAANPITSDSSQSVAGPLTSQTASNKTTEDLTKPENGSELGNSKKDDFTGLDSLLQSEINAGASDVIMNMGPFNVTMNYFGKEILTAYSNVDELSKDLEQAGLFIVNQAISRNTQMGDIYGGVTAVPRDGVDTSLAEPMPVQADTAAEGGAALRSSDVNPVGEDVNDFGTNNQETKVEEGDVIVSDGTYVYAAYGDYLAIWNPRSGEMVTQVKMPSVQEYLNEINGTRRTQFADSSYYYYAKANIQQLVIHENRLMVVVNGYGDVIRQEMKISDPMLWGFLSTHLRIYDISSLASGQKLTLVGTKDIHGNFNELRVVDGNAFVLTMANINTYSTISNAVERWQMNKSMTNQEYEDEAVRIAREQNLAKTFADKLIAELELAGNIPNLTKIALWQDHPAGGGFESMMFSDGPINTLALVNSLSMTDDSETLKVSSSGTFLPGYWARFYGSTDTLMVAGEGYTFDVNRWESTQATYFIGYSISGGTPVPHSVGSVTGSLLNNYAIDVVGDTMRVATTVNQGWRVFPIMLESASSSTGSDAGQADNSTASSAAEPFSRTENYVIVLQMPGSNGGDPGVMEELGRIQIGKANETITAVRFFDDVAYAVTFERKDPFYVLNLTDPKNPNIAGELEISGFSEYLHPIDDENKMLLAVGQEADDEGNILGVQLTVFDVTNSTNPRAVQRYVVEQDKYTWSWSEMAYDFKAGRYNRQSQRLIIPMDIYAGDDMIFRNGTVVKGSDSFNGFMTFVVNSTMIAKSCEVEHGNENDPNLRSCYYCAFFPSRSMIFDGQLMTVKNHFVESTNMNTCQQNWDLEVVINDESGGCCGIWW